MEQIKRIQTMEHILDEVTEVVSQLSDALEAYEKVQSKIDMLHAYDTSEQWIQDYDSDCAGNLPQDLKRGVLAQDTLDTLFLELQELKKFGQELMQDQKES